MAEPHPHHTDPIEENIETHPLKLAIGVVIGAAAMIVGLILLVQFAIGAYGLRSPENDPAMSPERIAERIAPVATLAVEANAPAPAASAMPAAPAPPVATVAVVSPPAASPSAGAGKATFDKVCTACHSAGVLGAPKFGNKADWAPRIAKGKAALYHSALNGKNAMPAKGGDAALSEADVKAAVDYMVAAAK
ncbi:MAG TPA: c-type cytochrome [Usitatibacter sp.]|nr:c-type cytochrome [Usitatibacter sp.]